MCQRNWRLSNEQTQGQGGSDEQSIPHEFGRGELKLNFNKSFNLKLQWTDGLPPLKQKLSNNNDVEMKEMN